MSKRKYEENSCYTKPVSFEHPAGRYTVQKRGGGPGYFGAGPLDFGHFLLEWKGQCTGNGDLKMWFVMPDYGKHCANGVPDEASFDHAMAQFKKMFFEAATKLDVMEKQ